MTYFTRINYIWHIYIYDIYVNITYLYFHMSGFIRAAAVTKVCHHDACSRSTGAPPREPLGLATWSRGGRICITTQQNTYITKNCLCISTIHCPSTTGTTGTCNLILILRGDEKLNLRQNNNNNNKSTKCLNIISLSCHSKEGTTRTCNLILILRGGRLVNLGQK